MLIRPKAEATDFISRSIPRSFPIVTSIIFCRNNLLCGDPHDSFSRRIAEKSHYERVRNIQLTFIRPWKHSTIIRIRYLNKRHNPQTFRRNGFIKEQNHPNWKILKHNDEWMVNSNPLEWRIKYIKLRYG